MHRRHLNLLPLLSALLLPATPVWAVYKCNEAGGVRYTDIPCPGGDMIDIKPPPANTAAAPKKAAQDRTALKQLETERRNKDRKNAQEQLRHARANAARQKKNKKCALLAQRQQWAEDDWRQADSKTKERARRQHRRATESHQRECSD